MSPMNIAQRLEAEDLARAKCLTQDILDKWDFMTWHRLLADDVVLSLRLESIGIDGLGDMSAAGGNLQVEGLDSTKRVLKSIYDDIKSGILVTTEILSGYGVALLGDLTLESTTEGAAVNSWPIVIYMKFNSQQKICVMTIATVDLQPLSDAVLSAAKIGALRAA